MLTTLGYVLKNLRRQKLRTVLSSLGVVLGVWLVVVFHGIAAGAVATTEAMLTQFGEDFHCYQAGAADPFVSVLPEAETREKLLSVPGVAEAASVQVWVMRTPDFDYVILYGLRPEEFAYQNLMRRGRGGFREEIDGPQVIVGEARRQKLGIRLDENGDVEAGQSIRLGALELPVVGSFRTGQVFFDHAVVVPMQTLWKIRGGEDTTILFAARIAEGERVDEVTARVEEKLPELATVSSLDEYSKVDKGLEQLKTWQTVITVVATVVGLLFILLAMVMAVFERTREIGILRAVGWRKRRIVLIIILEAMTIAVIGVVVGIPTGLLGVEIISSATDLSEFIIPTYEGGLYLTALLVALSAALIGGLYPAWRASRLHPVEAIRHE